MAQGFYLVKGIIMKILKAIMLVFLASLAFYICMVFLGIFAVTAGIGDKITYADAFIMSLGMLGIILGASITIFLCIGVIVVIVFLGAAMETRLFYKK